MSLVNSARATPGSQVRLIGKVAGVSGDLLRVMAADGREVNCRVQNKPNGLIVQVCGTVDASGVLVSDGPVMELPGDLDMAVLNEAIELQWAKAFRGVFVQ